MKAKVLQQKSNNDEVLSESSAPSTIQSLDLKLKRVNIDLPQWMINALDWEAKRLGVQRQSVIKFWLSERLDASSLGLNQNGTK